MTDSDDIELHNVLTMLEDLANAARDELKLLEYDNSSKACELLRVKDGRAEKKQDKARSLILALLGIDETRAFLQEQKYLRAMQSALMAMRNLVISDIKVASDQRQHGQQGGRRQQEERTKRETYFQPEQLLALDEEIRANHPDLPTIRRIQRIANVSGKTPAAVKRALQRARKKRLVAISSG